jgi:hypothetical protein
MGSLVRTDGRDWRSTACNAVVNGRSTGIRMSLYQRPQGDAFEQRLSSGGDDYLSLAESAANSSLVLHALPS